MPAGLFLTFTAADIVSQFSTRLQYGHISSIAMQLELVILEFWYDIGGPDGTQRFFLGAWLWIRNSEEVKEAGSLHRWDYRGERDSFSTGKWKVIGSSAHCQCALEECGGSFIPQTACQFIQIATHSSAVLQPNSDCGLYYQIIYLDAFTCWNVFINHDQQILFIHLKITSVCLHGNCMWTHFQES